jgi:hypothetical protein
MKPLSQITKTTLRKNTVRILKSRSETTSKLQQLKQYGTGIRMDISILSHTKHKSQLKMDETLKQKT